ncbi:MAG: hypothetical protein AVDCRST_MAG02-449, partial [uncultured Rubrobacteraceae bacterium]
EQAGEDQERGRPVLEVLPRRALQRGRGYRGAEPFSVVAADPGDHGARALQRRRARAREREQLYREHAVDLPGPRGAQPAPDDALLSAGAPQRRDQHRDLLGAYTPAPGRHGYSRVPGRERGQDRLRRGGVGDQLFHPALRGLLPKTVVQWALV